MENQVTLNSIQASVVSIQTTVSSMQATMGSMQATMNSMQASIEALTKIVGVLVQDVAAIKTRLDQHDQMFQELLETMNEFAQRTEKRFIALETRMTSVESHMLTTTHFDYKIADVRGDFSATLRKEDTRVSNVVDVLYERKVFTPKEKVYNYSISPFTPRKH